MKDTGHVLVLLLSASMGGIVGSMLVQGLLVFFRMSLWLGLLGLVALAFTFAMLAGWRP